MIYFTGSPVFFRESTTNSVKVFVFPLLFFLHCQQPCFIPLWFCALGRHLGCGQHFSRPVHNHAWQSHQILTTPINKYIVGLLQICVLFNLNSCFFLFLKTAWFHPRYFLFALFVQCYFAALWSSAAFYYVAYIVFRNWSCFSEPPLDL